MLFSLVWLLTEGNLSERELARLIDSEFREGCVYYYSTFLLNLIVLLLFTGTG
jgi:hypothetical protein